MNITNTSHNSYKNRNPLKLGQGRKRICQMDISPGPEDSKSLWTGTRG